MEYLETSPRPANSPTASHQLAFPEAVSSARAQSVRPQKNTEGASGVASTAPMPTSSVALRNSTDSPATRGPNSRKAVRQSTSDPMAADRMPTSLSPSAVSPAICWPSQIHQATIGG